MKASIFFLGLYHAALASVPFGNKKASSSDNFSDSGKSLWIGMDDDGNYCDFGKSQSISDNSDETITAEPKDSPSTTDAEILARAIFYRGLPTSVARRLGVSLSFVCRIIKGRSTSARVRRAILAEVRRIEKALKEKKRHE